MVKTEASFPPMGLSYVISRLQELWYHEDAIIVLEGFFARNEDYLDGRLLNSLKDMYLVCVDKEQRYKGHPTKKLIYEVMNDSEVAFLKLSPYQNSILRIFDIKILVQQARDFSVYPYPSVWPK
jgi:hypothetical protein